MKLKQTLAFTLVALLFGCLGFYFATLMGYAQKVPEDTRQTEKSHKSLKPNLKLDAVEKSIIEKIANATPSDFIGKENSTCTSSLSYLGQLGNYRFATIKLEFKPNCALTTRVIVLDSEYRYLGNYYMHGELPSQVFRNGLLMNGTEIGNFTTGIPDSLKIVEGLWTTFDSGQ